MKTDTNIEIEIYNDSIQILFNSAKEEIGLKLEFSRFDAIGYVNNKNARKMARRMNFALVR